MKSVHGKCVTAPVGASAVKKPTAVTAATKPSVATPATGPSAAKPAAAAGPLRVGAVVPAARAAVAAPSRAAAAPIRPPGPKAPTSGAGPATRQVAAKPGVRSPQGPAGRAAQSTASPKKAGTGVIAAPAPAAAPTPQAFPAAVAEAAEGSAAAPPPAPEPVPEAPPPPPPPPPVLDGQVTVRYNHYKPSLAVTGGRLAASVIDEELYLSGVFKKCELRLQTEKDGGTVVTYDGSGAIGDTTFTGLTPGATYWIAIIEDPEEAAAAEARAAVAYAAREAARAAQPAPLPGGGIVREKMEGCSCIEGNPCMDAYGCKDWTNRYTVAKAHGWRGP